MGINLGPLTGTTTETLKNKGTAVKGGLANAQPGDLLFFDTYKKNGHVVIYLGNNQFIGAQGKTGIGIVDLNSDYGSYFKKRFSGNIRRIAGGSNVGAMAGGAGGSGGSKNLSYGLVGTGTGQAYQMAPSAVRTVINIEAQKQKVNPYLIASIIKQESAFKYNAGSGDGAKGYMQLMPETAKSLGVTNVYDAGQNIAAGTKYVAQQIRKFGSIELGLAAYNAGPGNVNKAIRKAGGRTDWASVSRYLPKETRNYVPKVMQYR